eukprot:TRINITY_DN4074_c0_g1_i1.p1 TRINITY_DN4074_c0_g1~~TRINITY_DN4074_c0_g1_i1.p1  ORF type:complete len:320 (-),score=92.00 TRINITY_DN4074_c0_g1_i1:203-1162(-)
MATTVFVRGFDFGTSEDAIEKHCSQAGVVVSTEMQGKGAAVVTYSNEEEAKAAVKELNNSTIGTNTRYIDVKLNDDVKSSKHKKREESDATKRSNPSLSGPTCRVFVRGFEYGTSEMQLAEHMAPAGSVEKIQMAGQGNAIITYSESDEAKNAVKTLNKSKIDGQSRYIDVIQGQYDDGSSESNLPAKRARTGGDAGGAGWTWVWVPGMGTVPAFAGGKGKGKGGGGKKGGKSSGSGKEDPPGSGRVFVRGFDFGASKEELLDHMRSAGEIHDHHWVSKGSAIVVYEEKSAAKTAAETLNGTTFSGHSRYIDVILKASE